MTILFADLKHKTTLGSVNHKSRKNKRTKHTEQQPKSKRKAQKMFLLFLVKAYQEKDFNKKGKQNAFKKL